MSIPYLGLPGLLSDEDQLRPQLTPIRPPSPAIVAPLPITMQTAPKRVSLFERMKDRLLPMPQGFDGLLSPDQVSQARGKGLLDLGVSLLGDSGTVVGGPAPTLGQALAHGIQAAQAGTQQSAQQAVQGGLLQDDLDREHQIRTARQRISQAFPQMPNETREQTENRLSHMYAAYVQTGDTQSAAALDGVMKSIYAREPATKFQAVQAGDAVYTFDPSSGRYVKGPDRGMPEDQKQIRLQQLEQERLRTESLRDERDRSRAQSQARAFSTQTQNLADTAQPYQLAKNAFAEARSGNPAALKTAIIGFAGVADPKAQLRQGIINMVGQVDPSIKGNFDLALARLTSGTLPTRVLDNMEQLVDRIHSGNAGLYEQRRAAEVKRHPELDGWLPATSDIFGVLPNPGATSGKYSTGNPFVRKP